MTKFIDSIGYMCAYYVHTLTSDFEKWSWNNQNQWIFHLKNETCYLSFTILRLKWPEYFENHALKKAWNI